MRCLIWETINLREYIILIVYMMYIVYYTLACWKLFEIMDDALVGSYVGVSLGSDNQFLVYEKIQNVL